MRTKDYDKQQRIKDAMMQLVLRYGIDGTSVSKIAREANVSPATIYVYYDSKEAMLAEVFREYAHAPYGYVKERLHPDMPAGELVETVVRGYYAFAVEHKEVFSFVEQASRCPTLTGQVCDEKCSCDVLDLVRERQARGEIRSCSVPALVAVMFAPIRYLAMVSQSARADRESQLDEIVAMVRDMLVV